jgi:monoamine oxidase
MIKKIILLDASFSGPYAGCLLQEPGYQVTILEASNRVSGRVFTDNGIDLGGA